MTPTTLTAIEQIQLQGGAAFPLLITEGRKTSQFAGLTIRDYFAGQALMGYLSGRNNDDRDSRKENVARSCYEYADAMLKEFKLVNETT